MKKMVCEICGSQSIKKEDGVFVCKECGTEYSLEEAKKLLQDIDSPNNDNQKLATKSDYTINTNALKEQLLLWGKIVYFFDSLNDLVCGIETTDPSFWNNERVLSIVPKGRMYGPTDNIWDSKKVDGIKNYSLVYLDFDHRLEFIKDLLSRYENMQESIKRTFNYDEYVNNFRSAINTLNSLKKDVDFDLSCNFWKVEFDKLIKEEFCFKEIDDVTVRDNLNYIGYNMINNANSSEYVDTNNVNKAKYFEFLCCFHYYYDDSNRPVFTVKKMFSQKYVQAFPRFDFKQFYNKVHNKLLSIHNKYCSFYQNVIVNAFNESIKAINQYISASKELENNFFLPYEYRKTSYIVTLIDLLETGKASNWKELSNLFDTNLYRDKVIGSLDSINSRLTNIEANLKQTNSLLTSIDSDLKKIDQKLEDISQTSRQLLKSVNKIRKASFITMWNTL